MNGLNGIIIGGDVYELIKGGDCDQCDFNKDVLKCQNACNSCREWDCAFHFSQSLTDKINGNGIQ